MLGRRTYIDFEPFSKWNKGEESDTLELHLHGFRKDQIRVQVNSVGNLLVTGERQLENKRWSRFRLEVKLSLKFYCPNSVHAKLGNGILYIIVPKKDVNPPRLSPQQAVNEKRRPDSEKNHQMVGMDPYLGEPNAGEIGSEELGQKGSYWRLGFVDRRRVLQVSVAVLAAAAIGVGTYLASKYWFNRRDNTDQSVTEFIPF
ncbi:inactive protein RESTRICTED TEV MOVEMENT 2 [Punica granatum]|uniref:Inactive protein RESTRICTED TEV MOVEMENT 2 n=1 Tax=Punica granatum TaxID=22663 RepID=A0A6P8DGJ6_PUNGR|nr:inactive protein RESTRICTED TEV MOVEMENT 2 [Punica granatum]